MADGEMRKYYLFAFRAFGDTLATILIPAFVALGLKYWLHLNQAVFLILLAVTFLMTSIVLVRKIRSYGRSFQQLSSSQDESRSARG